MAFANYGDLKTRLANWFPRDDLTTTRIPEFITFGESMLFTDLRVREMEATATITTTTAQREDALPTRFVQARALYTTGSPNVRLEYRSEVEYWSVYANFLTGQPTVFTVVGENLLWAPVPDTTYSIKVDHYARPAAFSADGDTNSVFARWPQLYYYAALVHAMPFVGDDRRVPGIVALYQEQLAAAHDADRRDRASGDPVPPSRTEQMT
jgi:hypothetical protein